MNERIRLGYWDKTCKEPLYYAGDAHGLVVAPTRRGKFRDVYGPMLLSMPHNAFVLCPKGQSPAVTARYRRDVLRHDVKVLNPFGILMDSLGDFEHVQYCPVTSKLDPKSKTFAIDADNLAEGWLPFTSDDKHWVLGGRKLASALAMHLRSDFDRWSLPDIYRLICDPNLYAFCQHVIDEGAPPAVVNRLGRFAGDAAKENREVRSIVSAAITGLGFVDNEPIANNMGASTMDFADMRTRPMTVYVVLPEEYLETCSSWMRTITNAWASACLKPGASEYKILGILQEAATTIGNLSSIDTLNAMGAGHKCQLISEFQDLNQLVKLKGRDGWQTFLANAGFHIYLGAGIGDMFTSGHISAMTGTVDIPTVSRSISDGQGQGFQLASGLVDGINRSLRGLGGGNGTQVSIGSRQKPYLLSEDVRECDNGEMLVFAEGVRGLIRAGRKPYYETPEFAGRYDEDPYHAARSHKRSA